MKTENTTQRIEKLEEVVTLLDTLSQTGFDQISAIATLALLSLETPADHRPAHTETLAIAIEAIGCIADDIRNCINCEAENVGLNYKNERAAARHKARQEGAKQSSPLIKTTSPEEVTA